MGRGGGKRCRGAAAVELALVAPLFVALFWFAVWLTELAGARLLAQEEARSLAWSVAGRPPETWEAGLAMARSRAERRLSRHAGFALAWTDVSRMPIPLRFPAPASVGGGGALAGWVSAVLGRGTAALLDEWGLASNGQLEGNVRLRIENPYPVPWREVGLDALSRAELSARVVLWEDDGHLDDGSDVEAPRTPSALYRRVKRLTYLGQPEAFAAAESALRALPLVSHALPSLSGTFVVSKAYRHEPDAVGPPRCDGIPGYRAAAGTESGLRDFLAGGAGLDHEHPRCFDTAPFRDSHAYPRGDGSSGNLSMQIFRKRGPYFLGCLKPMAQGARACEAP